MSEKDKKPPTREDVVKKIEDLDKAIEDSTQKATSKLKVAAVVGIAVIAVIAFSSGRRRALRPKTVVSFTKLK